jgi:hypothetical protein
MSTVARRKAIEILAQNPELKAEVMAMYKDLDVEDDGPTSSANTASTTDATSDAYCVKAAKEFQEKGKIMYDMCLDDEMYHTVLAFVKNAYNSMDINVSTKRDGKEVSVVTEQVYYVVGMLVAGETVPGLEATVNSVTRDMVRNAHKTAKKR